LDKTLAIIKPDCTAKNVIGKVIDRIENAGFKILGLKMVRLTKNQAKKFYEVHKERPFYNDLVEFMTSGPVVVMALQKENAVTAFRNFIGATNPEEAAEGTIRKDFGSNIQNNCVHGSDSDENAKREIGFFFSETELI
jgi:nucleoside-diphosphate kinase